MPIDINEYILPEKPGCYLWKKIDREEKVLYVGKAQNIKKRVLQYFHSKEFKAHYLLKDSNTIDWIITNNEQEALLLENQLIKQYNPPFNTRLKDDKKYPFFCLTLGEPFPRLIVTRKKDNPQHEYFGPFANVKAARNALNFIHKLFPLRKKPLKLPQKKKLKPCLNYHIKRCLAPCTGEVKQKTYHEIVSQVYDLLNGNIHQLQEKLSKKMELASTDLDFELANRYKNIICDLKTATQFQNIYSENEQDNYDIVFLYYNSLQDLFKEKNFISLIDYTFIEQSKNFVHQVIVLKIRLGNLTAKQSFNLSENQSPIYKKALNFPSLILKEFFREYYLNQIDIPPYIYTSHIPEDQSHWESILSQKTNSKILIYNFNDDKKPLYQHKIHSLIKIAKENSISFLRERLVKEQLDEQKIGLKEIKKLLNLKEIPYLIEFYDISNLQGKHAVGSGVVFKNAVPNKNQYRKYKIQTKDTPDDPKMMYEVLSRRFQRLAKKEFTLPNLIVIDGGITQLNAAKLAMDEYHLDIPIVGLAKKLEEIYTLDKTILHINKNSLGMLILRRGRDEAHRFAITFHRNLREKN